jgi:hypothetical protein
MIYYIIYFKYIFDFFITLIFLIRFKLGVKNQSDKYLWMKAVEFNLWALQWQHRRFETLCKSIGKRIVHVTN